VVAKAKAYGAEKVYVIDDAELKGYLVAPKAEAMAQLSKQALARRDHVPIDLRGKEVAAAWPSDRVRPDHRRGRRTGRGRRRRR
jgi:electron transfer flavoprotein alpha subunit